MGCCGNAKGHCRNAPCNSSIAAMMQQREHCGNALQYCSNTCCGNVEGHCKQHQHCGNIAAIRALKRVLRQCAEALQAIRALPQCAEALQQYGHCRNALRHCSNTPLRQCDAALLQHCNNAILVAGVASCSPWRRVVAVGLLVFVGRGARWSPERSISFAGALGGPLSVAFCSQGR